MPDAAPTEFYQSRGPGLSHDPCFICGRGGSEAGQSGTLQMDMAAFVKDKEAGERVVEMFWAMKGHARLDYREYEPQWVQVKIGACLLHEPNLQLLVEETHRRDKTISLDILKRVWPRKPEPVEEVIAKYLKGLADFDSYDTGIIGDLPRPTMQARADGLVLALSTAGYDLTPAT